MKKGRLIDREKDVQKNKEIEKVRKIGRDRGSKKTKEQFAIFNSTKQRDRLIDR